MNLLGATLVYTHSTQAGPPPKPDEILTEKEWLASRKA